MVITSHICRGNYHSTFFTRGPYDTVADYVFAKENDDALFIEYDEERYGGIAGEKNQVPETDAAVRHFRGQMGIC